MSVQSIYRVCLLGSVVLLLSGCVVHPQHHPHQHRHVVKPVAVVVKPPVVVRKAVVVRPVVSPKVVVRKVVIDD